MNKSSTEPRMTLENTASFFFPYKKVLHGYIHIDFEFYLTFFDSNPVFPDQQFSTLAKIVEFRHLPYRSRESSPEIQML